jgi:hypothetical protein
MHPFFSGICMRRKEAFDRDALHFAPFLLFPSPFPKEEFEKAVQLQVREGGRKIYLYGKSLLFDGSDCC